MAKIEKLPRRVGQRVLRARTASGLSLRTLAQESRVSTGTISTLERGMIADPGIVTLGKLAKALNVKLVTLVKE